MKRLSATLLLVPLLAACGGPGVPPTVVEPGKDSGTITLRLIKGDVGTAALPDPSNIRVSVTNLKTGFRSVKDAAIGSAQNINVPVPATTDYVVEAISYKPGAYTSRNLLLKYGMKDGVTVESGKTTNVTLELQRPEVTVSIPSSVTTGQAFNINVSNVPSYLRSSLRAEISNQPTSSSSTGLKSFYPTNGTISANAPSEVGSGRMYIQVYSFVDTDKFCIDCGSELFRFDTNDSMLGQTPLSAALNPPESAIGIIIKY